jgi:NADPH2:quinone reductase
VFDMLESGAISVSIHQRYALQDAAQAHVDLQARKTSGSTLLLP